MSAPAREEIRVVCGWCGGYLRGLAVASGTPVSHGICGECFVAQVKAIRLERPVSEAKAKP